MAQVCSFVVDREWKILIVDYDHYSLLRLEEMLQSCSFKVTKCQYAKEAIRILQEDRYHYDIVIVDVHLPDMNGFELLKRIGIETNLPVIMTSTNDDDDQIKKGMLYGASDYLIKPIQMENVRYLWKYVYRKQRHEELIKGRVEQSGSSSSDIINMNDYCKRVPKNACIAPISDHGKDYGKCMKKRKIADTNGDQQMNDDATTKKKKQRVIWTPELHAKFVEAINQLGTEKPVPKKILEIMNVPELTRENVASHLQKYRQYHKRMEQTLQYQSENLPPISSDNQIQTSSCSLQLQGLNSHSQVKVSKIELENYSQVVHHVESSNVFCYHTDSHAYSTTFDSTIEGQIFGSGDVSGTRVDDDIYESYVLDFCYNDAALFLQPFGHQFI